jgi:cytochrome c-type biogenesis protein
MVQLEVTLALAAGLLASTMTPCLIQLVFFYFAAISGVSVSEAKGGELTKSEMQTYKRRVVGMTAAFSLGVLIVIVGSGVLIGYLGSSIRDVPLWSGDAIWAQRVAGVAFLIIGVWMANITRAPMLCKIPFPSIRRNPEELGFIGLFAAGFVFMFGCATCFSGAIFATLLVYIGTSTAPLTGGLIMFFFALGIIIPLMLSAVLLTRVVPHISNMQKASKYMGLISTVFILAMGLLAISGHFHTVSDLIWEVVVGTPSPRPS